MTFYYSFALISTNQRYFLSALLLPFMQFSREALCHKLSQELSHVFSAFLSFDSEILGKEKGAFVVSTKRY